MATDQFCLRWNNFQVNITSALESLKSDEDLVDVTLTCEGQNVKAHKVILSACSPYFRNVFKENPCQHPVVILKDVRYEDVTALLNFMYHGEVYITQDRLAPFLHTAELLQVRGLTGAANPFKEMQTPAPILQSKPLQQQQQPPPQQQQLPLKVKKNPMPIGQQRRGSPSTVPLSSPVKAHRATRSPLISPPPKDLAAVAKETTQTILNRDSDIDPSSTPASPLGLALQGLQSSASCSSVTEQPGTSYSPLYTEQTTFSAPVSPATFQQHSNDSSSQLLSLPFTNVSRAQNTSQPSSPPAAKRRKTFPRRVSSSQLSTEQIESPLNVSDSAKEFSQDSTDPVDSETVLKDVAVKIERSDVDVDNEPDEEEGLSTFSQENLAVGDGDLETGGFSKQKTDFDEQMIEEQEVGEEESGDGGGGGGGVPSGQSMLMRSLSGQLHAVAQGDGSPTARSGTTGKTAPLPHVPQCGTCPHCGQTYSNQSALKYHVRLMHTDMTNRHCCHLCPRSFALRDVFKAHMWSKHQQRC